MVKKHHKVLWDILTLVTYSAHLSLMRLRRETEMTNDQSIHELWSFQSLT